MKSRKQLKQELIDVINESKIIDYIVRYHKGKITIEILQGKMKNHKKEDYL